LIKVDARARLHADRAGEPLDGLVNMFDIGIILAVGFLIAALQALNQIHALTEHKVKHSLTIPKESEPIKAGQEKLRVKNPTPVGQVYEGPNGELIYVKKP